MNKSAPLTISLRIPALFGLEVVAAETAADLAQYAGAPESVASDIRLAVIEGCINAIEHAYSSGKGANCDECMIELAFGLVPADPASGTTAKMTIRIRDNGRGFDLGAYEEPSLEKKLHSSRKRGWGLRLIRGFMDDLEIISGQAGTTIEMTKFLPPVEG